MRWRVNPERGPTELEIRFTPEGSKTRVDLEHRGWDDPEGRANHGPGWTDYVLGRYSESCLRRETPASHPKANSRPPRRS